MNGGGLKRKQPEGPEKAEDALEPGSTPAGDQEQQPEQPQPSEQGEQPKRQKQQNGATEEAEQDADVQRQTIAGGQQESRPAAGPHLLADGSSKEPAVQHLQQPQPLPRQRQAEGQQKDATQRAAQHPAPRSQGDARAPRVLSAARQQHWGTPPQSSPLQQHQRQQWRPAQARLQPQPQPQPSAAPWQPAAQPWQAPPGGQGWQQQHAWGPQQAQLGSTWDAPPGQAPGWDPAPQQWPAPQAQHWSAPAGPLAGPVAAAATAAGPWPQAQAPLPPPAPVVHAPVQQLAPQQALALQQQLLLQQQAMALQQLPAQQQAHHNARPRPPRSKLERDLPLGGQGEALLRLAVRICCERLGYGEHDGGQLGKVLEELDRNWRRGQCGGYSVSVLLKELDRRGLVMAREEMSSGKRICIFRNLAC